MKPLIVANWKMNKTVKESMQVAREIKEAVRAVADKEVIVCPSFVALAELRTIFHRSNVKLGAQNMHFEEKGAFTGETSSLMLKELCEYVILGHSERRHVFDESSYIINKKVKAALKHGLKPILCVGETLEERENGQEKEVVESQLKESLDGIEVEECADLTVSYEPVWAIGTGKVATPKEAEHVQHMMRDWLDERFGDAAKQIRILYGGSVKEENAAELLAQPHVQGVLIGGASLESESFAKIVKAK